MRVIAIIFLMGMVYMAIQSLWAVAIVAILPVIGWLIKTDRHGASIDNFFAGCFFLSITVGLLSLVARII